MVSLAQPTYFLLPMCCINNFIVKYQLCLNKLFSVSVSVCRRVENSAKNAFISSTISPGFLYKHYKVNISENGVCDETFQRINIPIHWHLDLLYL